METESVAKRAIALLTERGAMRTAQIAEALGCASADVSASLGAYVRDGRLAACKVEQPGTPPMNEYRIGAGGKTPGFRQYKPKQTPRAAPPAPAAPAAAAETPAKPKRAYKRSAPVRKVQRNTAKTAKPAKRGLRADAHKTRPNVRGAHRNVHEPHRNVHKAHPAAKPRIVPGRAAAGLIPSAFRTAIASDGAMIFLGAAAGAFELNRGETRAVIDFVRTLDRGEVSA